MIDCTINWNTWGDFEGWWVENAQDITADDYYNVCGMFQRHNIKKLLEVEIFENPQDISLKDWMKFRKIYNPISKEIYNMVEEHNPVRQNAKSEGVIAVFPGTSGMWGIL